MAIKHLVWLLLVVSACCARAQVPIGSCFELQQMNQDLNGVYVLTADIDCTETATWNSGEGFEPIGKQPNGGLGTPFTGILEGGGYRIFNLTINRASLAYMGLFARIDNGGEVHHLTLIRPTVVGKQFAGALAGFIDYGTKITHCAALSVTVSALSHVGGLVGFSRRSVFEQNNVTGTISNTGDYTGGLIGYGSIGITIDNCEASVDVTGIKYVGGLVGGLFTSNQNSFIHRSTAFGNVAGSAYVGGLLGWNAPNTNEIVLVSQCTAFGNVTGSGGMYVGGLVGDNQGTIVQSRALGFVISTGSYTGGLVGRSVGEIIHCYARGDVSGMQYVGGLIGGTLTGSRAVIIAFSYATGQVTGSSFIGGLIGQRDADIIFTSYWDVETSAQAGSDGGTGATTAQMYQTGTYAFWDFNCVWEIQNGVSYPVLRQSACGLGVLTVNTCADLQRAVFWSGSVALLQQNIDCAETSLWAGGGFTPGLLIPGSRLDGQGYAISDITINRATADYVGLLSRVESGAVIQDIELVNAAVSASSWTGVLAAQNFGLIKRCGVTGQVTGTGQVGGLVGFNQGRIVQSYAEVQATGSSNVGGLVGYLSDGTVAMCYATGSVTGSSNVGGLIGLEAGSPSIVFSSYWDTESSGQLSSASGIGKSTAQMRQRSEYVAWDFNCTWAINEGAGYPTLTHQSCGVVQVSDCDALQGAVFSSSDGISLLNDIDCNETTAWDGGAGFVPGLLTSGVFDGNGYQIINLTINRLTVSQVGLFAQTEEGAWVANVTLANLYVAGKNAVGGLIGENNGGAVIGCSVTGSINANGDVGGLIGVNNGNVMQSNFSGNVISAGATAGGLIGEHQGGLVSQAHVLSATVVGTNYLGGLVGSHDGGTLSGCRASATVLGDDDIGGLTSLNGGRVVDCVAISTVTGGRRVGGLVGQNKGIISRCHATTNATGSRTSVDPVGGLVGLNADGGVIINSTASGNVTTTGHWAGGLAGQTDRGALIQNCHAAVNVEGLGAVGGLIGYFGEEGSRIQSCTASGNVKGASTHVGGLLGRSEESVVTDSSASGNVMGPDDYVGGLIGQAQGTTVTRCYASGNVQGLGNYVGGLVGGNTDASIIETCYATGTVIAAGGDAGGLVGTNAGTIRNAYAVSQVNGTNTVGGLVGSSTGAIVNCYAISTIAISGSGVGGLVATANGVVQSSYWDSDVSELSISAGGAPRTSRQMEVVSTFVNWDFDNVWLPGCRAPPQLRAFLSASGTVEYIDSCAALQAACFGNTLILTQDIDCSESASWDNQKGFDPLGWFESASFASPFTGTFDGQGYTISHLFIDRPMQDYVGLFGYVGSGAQIQRLALFNATITGNRYVGALAGWNNGELRALSAQGRVVGHADIVGGVVGWNAGTLIEAISEVSVTGSGDFVGGLAGWNQQQIIDSYSVGPVIGTGTGVGGLVGFGDLSAVVTASYWDIDRSGRLFSSGGTGKPTRLMQWSGTYATWNFTSTWWVACQAYPQLRVLTSGGGFTEAFNISTCGELQAVCVDANVRLMQDIDCRETATWNDGFGFLPLGWFIDATTVASFSGIFDGQGFQIMGLTINRPDEDHMGLFGYTSPTAEIKNVILVDANIRAKDSVGGLIGTHYGVVSDSHVSASLTVTGETAGMLVGTNLGTVHRCSATGVIAGTDILGGLVGSNAGAISESHASTEVKGNRTVAGLVARNTGMVHQSSASGEVRGTIIVGGLIADNTGTVAHCYSASTVVGEERVGGLLGSHAGSVVLSFVNGSTTGIDIVGGLVGINTADIVQCAGYGEVTGQTSVGGIVGEHHGSLLQSYAVGATHGDFQVGGLIGTNRDGTLIECYAAGCVQGSQAGGLLGSVLDTDKIERTYWDQDTTGQLLPATSGRYYDVRRAFRKHTAALQKPNTFDDWSLGTVWEMCATRSYPCLIGLGASVPTKPNTACPVPPPLFEEELNGYIAMTLVGVALALMMLAFLHYCAREDLQAKLASPDKLHWMAAMGQLAIVKYLLSKQKQDGASNAPTTAGANAALLKTDEEGCTPLDCAARGGHAQVAAYLHAQDKTQAVQHAAILGGQRQHRMVLAMLPDGERLWGDHQHSQQECHGETNPEDLITLLATDDTTSFYGTDINRRDAEGVTPLMKVIAAGDMGEAERLVREGADIFVCDAQGHNVIWHLIKQGERVEAQFLIRASPQGYYFDIAFALICEALQANTDTLTHLDLSGHGLDDAKLQALARALQNNTHVKTVDLSHNNITSLGVRGWYETGLPPALEQLILVNNLLDRLAAKYLLRALPNCQTLTNVVLGENVLLPKDSQQWKALKTALLNRAAGHTLEKEEEAEIPDRWKRFLWWWGATTLWLQPYHVLTVIGFLLEMADRISDAFLIRELLENQEPKLALASMCFLVTSYLVGLWGMRVVRGRWYPKKWQSIPYWLITLPVLSPDWVRLEWGLEYIDFRFAKLKLANFFGEDIPQFSIGVLFLLRKGTNTVVLLKTAIAFVASVFFLGKLILYDLPAMRKQLVGTSLWRRLLPGGQAAVAKKEQEMRELHL